MSSYEIIVIVLVVITVNIVLHIRRNVDITTESDKQNGEANILPSSLQPSNAPADWTSEQETFNQIQGGLNEKTEPLSDELQKIIGKILTIPYDYNELGSKSMYQLVLESGYTEVHEQITEAVLSEALAKHPHRINEWVQYSEDQRTSDGWFLRKDADKYYVGEFSTKGGYNESLTQYPDPKSACAAFIKRKIEYSRELAEADKQKRERKRQKQ